MRRRIREDSELCFNRDSIAAFGDAVAWVGNPFTPISLALYDANEIRVQADFGFR